MTTTTKIVQDLTTAITSCRQEASGELAGDRSEGLTCIADNLQDVLKGVQNLIKAAQAVVDNADSTGCTGDLTVTSKKAVRCLQKLVAV
jgi:hypothetical protein